MSEKPSETSGWIMLAVVALAAAVGQAFGRFAYGVLLPAVRDDLGISNTLAGLIGATNVGAYLLGTLLVAWATSRFKLLGVMRTGLILATSGLLLAGISNSPLLLAFALFTMGIGGALLWIPAPLIAAAGLPDHRRSLAVGLVGSGMGLGVVFVSLVSAGLRAEQGDSAWSMMYQLQFVIGFLILIAVLIFVRYEQERPSGGSGFGGFTALKRMPGWRPLIVTYGCFGLMYLMVVGFLTTRLEDDSGWSSTDAATGFTLTGMAMMVGGPIFVTIAQRLTVRLTLTLSFGLWSLFTAIILSGIYIPTLAACIGLGLVFSSLPTLITLYVVENTTAEDYGPCFAAATLVFGIAQIFSPAIGGYLADISGSFALVFALSATISIVGLMTSLRLPK